jgi:hypothetical protein
VTAIASCVAQRRPGDGTASAPVAPLQNCRASTMAMLRPGRPDCTA